MKKILLVEDEPGVIDFIKKGLTEQNYEVSVAFDAGSALQMANESEFDIYILDIMLPDKNGMEVCKSLRQRNIKSPVLFLSALGTSENIALGLNVGADDYLVKPFKFIELSARINALLRRHENNAFQRESNIYIVDDLKIDDDAKQVTRKGIIVNLTATEYRLLMVLVQNKGRVLSRVELLESVWSINFNMGTNVVDVYINYLRKKIDADVENKLIHTVVSMGYVLKEK
jgi:two-component system copper resistance phosphate regulon response regulator CusR